MQIVLNASALMFDYCLIENASIHVCHLCLDKNKIVLDNFVLLSVSHWMDTFEMITKEMFIFAPFFHVKILLYILIFAMLQLCLRF